MVSLGKTDHLIREMFLCSVWREAQLSSAQLKKKTYLDVFFKEFNVPFKLQ